MTVTLNDNAIITRQEIKDFLEDQSSKRNDIYHTLINAVSTMIESYCDRTFASTEHTEYYDGNGDYVLITDHYPITEIDSIYDDAYWSWASSDLIDSDDYRIKDDNTIVSQVKFATGVQNIKITYTAGYSSSTMPEDLKYACMQQVAYELDRKDDKNLIQKTLPDGSVTYHEYTLTPAVRAILNKYKRNAVI